MDIENEVSKKYIKGIYSNTHTLYNCFIHTINKYLNEDNLDDYISITGELMSRVLSHNSDEAYLILIL